MIAMPSSRRSRECPSGSIPTTVQSNLCILKHLEHHISRALPLVYLFCIQTPEVCLQKCICPLPHLWLRSSSLCRAWWLLDTLTGLMSFLGSISASRPGSEEWEWVERDGEALPGSSSGLSRWIRAGIPMSSPGFDAVTHNRIVTEINGLL